MPVSHHVKGPSVQSTVTAFTPAWQPFRLGAGGQITAIYSYADGTILARGDSYGGWLYISSGNVTYGGTAYAAPAWKQLVTPTSIPGFTLNFTDRQGVIELVAAPSNTNVLYMLWSGIDFPNGGLYVSTNKGTSWVKCINFVGTTQQANNTNCAGPFIAVDPNDPNTIYVDTLNSGVYKSTNGTSGASATFTQVATVGTTTGHVIVYQPGSSTHILIYTIGTAGAYESTNGSTFTLVATGSPPPNTITRPEIFADKFNQFWMTTAGLTGNLYKYAGGTWSTINPGSTRQVAGFAADPNSASVGVNHIVVTDFYGQPNISSDNGATWSGDNTNQTISVGALQPTWLSAANQGSAPILLNSYSVVFDQSSNLFLAGGLGIWQTNAPVVSSGTVWAANTLGIEQFVGIQIVSPPGGWPMQGVWDKGVFTTKNPDVFPTTYWNNSPSINAIIDGWNIDWSASPANFVVVYGTSNISASVISAFSTDGGNNWTRFTTDPSYTGPSGGNIAALTDQKWIVIPNATGAIQFTLNQGATWTQSTISGTPTNWIGVGVSQAIAADRVAANTYCAVTPSQVFYKSTDSGQTFAATGATSANVDGNAGLFALRSVPGQSGHYFYTAGDQNSTRPANIHLWKSTDTCTTFSDPSGGVLKEVISFGFGAHKPGAAGTYPTIYAWGWLNGIQGVYQSTDGGTTWTTINIPANQTPWPLNQADFPSWVEGDPDVYGRVYVCFAQSGGTYIDTLDACPSVKFTNTNANAALTGTVTLTAQHSGLVPVINVQFSVDGASIKSFSGLGPYSFSWNTASVANGSHTLKVTATGVNGTGSQSIPITTS